MKKILFFFTLIIVLTVFSVWANQTPNLVNADSCGILKHTLPDSLYTILKNKPIIFYSRGHYGYFWSLIARVDSTYQVYSGQVSYSGERYLNEISESDPSDTTKLFIHNNAILSWGFDTIAYEAMNMSKVNRTPYVSLWTDLSIFKCDGVNIFSSDGATAFSGKDSIAFNNKFHKLCLIMWWLADSRIREYIPDSAIY